MTKKGNAMEITTPMSLDSLVAVWLDQLNTVDTEYAQAAVALANHVASGNSEEVYRVEFDCALVKRNRMLDVLAETALHDVDKTVQELDCYEQYCEGLITAVECCNALTLLHCRTVPGSIALSRG